MDKKTTTYVIDGGFGKNVMFTAMIPKLAKLSKNGKINICTHYIDAFTCIDTSYIGAIFHQETIFNEDFKRYTDNVVFFEPYKSNFGLNGDGHLLKYWCEGYGIEYTKDMFPMPINILDKNIKSKVDEIVETYKDFIVVQFTGGQPYVEYNPENQYQNNNMQIQRNYPYHFANLLVSKIKKEYPNLTIIDYSLPNEHIGYKDAIRVDLPAIGYAELIKHAKTVIGIDSSLLHLASAQRVNGIGLFGGCPLWQFGWDIHKNITNFNGDIKNFNPNDPYYISIDSDIILKELEEFIQ